MLTHISHPSSADQCAVKKKKADRQTETGKQGNGKGYFSPSSCTVSDNEQKTVCARVCLCNRHFNVLPVRLLRQIYYF